MHYEEAGKLIDGCSQYKNARGEISIFMAYCLVHLKREREADEIMSKGLNVFIEDEERQQKAFKEYMATKEQVFGES